MKRVIWKRDPILTDLPDFTIKLKKKKNQQIASQNYDITFKLQFGKYFEKKKK